MEWSWLINWQYLLLTLISLIVSYAYWRKNFFARRGVQVFTKFHFLFGHMKDIVLHREHFAETLQKLYFENYGMRFFGFFAYYEPILVLHDLDLIKQVCVKDFEYFIDHRVFMDEEIEPLFGRNLFFLKGQKWRDMRAALSPAFTTSKMKWMFPLVAECSLEIRDALLDLIKENGGNDMQLEMKDMFTRYTNDVIASTAFGFKINSFKDRNNEFFTMGTKATNFSGFQFLKFQLHGSFPGLAKILKLPLFSKDVARFFRNLVYNTIKQREESKVSRHDMIHLLMLAKKGSSSYELELNNIEDLNGSSEKETNKTKSDAIRREWTNDDLTAQAIAFIVAGFGTPSSLLTFTAYELTKNLHVQKKLQEEIDDVMTKCDGNPTWNDIQEMKYMDMVISETLRLWPPDPFLERMCVKDYTFPPQDKTSTKDIEIKAGDGLIVPIFAIHRDPLYFANPLEFDPERFSDERKDSIKQLTYIPFGLGPRLCIGARFALMEAKVVFFHILAHMEFYPTSKTPNPFILAKDTFNMHPINGLWLGLRKRKHSVS